MDPAGVWDKVKGKLAHAIESQVQDLLGLRLMLPERGLDPQVGRKKTTDSSPRCLSLTLLRTAVLNPSFWLSLALLSPLRLQLLGNLGLR